MSSFEQCEAITEAKVQCNRKAKIEHLCTQHYNIRKEEIEDLLPISKVLTDNIVNAYLDYNEDITKLEKLTDFKFNKELHITEEKIINSVINQSEKKTFLDGNLIKLERWYKNGNKSVELNYNNGKLEGKQYGWHTNGNKYTEQNYKNGKLIESTAYRKN
jgi:antitoxin component YwqK of YwqJK toxin-antitoxin module